MKKKQSSFIKKIEDNSKESLLHLLYDDVRRIDSQNNETRYVVNDKGKYGVVDLERGLIIPTEYTRIVRSPYCIKVYGEVKAYAGNPAGAFNRLRYDVKENGLFDWDGNELVPMDLYDTTINLGNGVCLINHTNYDFVIYNPRDKSITKFDALGYHKESFVKTELLIIYTLDKIEKEGLLTGCISAKDVEYKQAFITLSIPSGKLKVSYNFEDFLDEFDEVIKIEITGDTKAETYLYITKVHHRHNLFFTSTNCRIIDNLKNVDVFKFQDLLSESGIESTANELAEKCGLHAEKAVTIKDNTEK